MKTLAMHDDRVTIMEVMFKQTNTPYRPIAVFGYKDHMSLYFEHTDSDIKTGYEIKLNITTLMPSQVLDYAQAIYDN